MLSRGERARIEEFTSALGCPLPSEAADGIGAYLDLLGVWNRRLRLTGTRERSDLLELHILDCLALAAVAPPGGRVADLGSGPGLPGIPLAIARPDVGVELIEARRRPVSFLREAVRELTLRNVHVFEGRGEELARRGMHFSAVVARAVPLRTLLEVGRALLEPGGGLVAMRGAQGLSAAEEEAAAERGFSVVREVSYELRGGRTVHRLVVLGGRDVSRETSGGSKFV